MKIVCPKCQSAYRVDLPDPGEAGIDVQCGKCLYIFLFTREDIEQSSNAVNQRGVPDLQSRASDLTENRPAEPILSPQKEQEQEVSRDKRKAPEAKKQAPSSQETPDELELELIPEDPEALEIVIEEEPPDDSLEEDALDEIWNQAIEEGTRTQPETQEKSPAPRSDAPIKQETTPTWEEAFADQAQVEARWKQAQETSQIREEQQLAEALGVEYTPPEPTPIEELVKKPPTENQQELVDRLFAEAKSKEASKKMRPAKRLPTSEERHREVDKIVAPEQTRQKTPKKTPLKKKSQPLPSMDERQRDIDLIIFRHQTLQEKTGDRPEPDTSSPLPSMEERQREIDEYIIAQRAKLKPPKDKTPGKEPTPPLPSLEERHRDVDSLVDRERAKLARETTQEDIDLEEEVSVDKEEAMPSWEEAFAHQAEVEADWRRAQEQDRIQEEQQLAEAMGEEYVPTEPPEATAAPATPENKQALVDDVFAQMKGQAQETSKKTPETAAPKSKMEKRQDEVDQGVTEAKTRQSRETTQEDIDPKRRPLSTKKKPCPAGRRRSPTKRKSRRIGEGRRSRTASRRNSNSPKPWARNTYPPNPLKQPPPRQPRTTSRRSSMMFLPK